jgi:flagellar hook assembly protein FlgD
MSEISVSYTKALLPSESALDPVFPNPFNPETRISFRLEEDTHVSLSILDLRGRIVRTLLAPASKPAGRYDFRWDATDDSNRKVAGGMYLVLLRAGDKVHSQKVLLMK